MEKLSQLGLLGAPSAEALFDAAVPQADIQRLDQDCEADMPTADGPGNSVEEDKNNCDEGVQYERLHPEGEGRQHSRSPSGRGPRGPFRRAHSQIHIFKPQDVAIRLSGMVF